ncbi:hypothetical protein XELAEV_18028035mg [Xenopus laevis]|uniref:Uncharacterized protein n=1 Tax=Xenopus laevis TaxID=8355 RepID=A0A974CYP6_XENLA|nr:hypothetical protein XELAEV_18028035mg [Xenopus laevis]
MRRERLKGCVTERHWGTSIYTVWVVLISLVLNVKQCTKLKGLRLTHLAFFSEKKNISPQEEGLCCLQYCPTICF